MVEKLSSFFSKAQPQPARADYLVVANRCIPMKLSARYAQRWQLMGCELYIDVACTQEISKNQVNVPLPPDCTHLYSIADANLFEAFFNSWKSGRLILYRGFPGCHFCIPKIIRTGSLESEGNLDSPQFTMGNNNTGLTRWLPTADQDIANGVSLQCCDPFTANLSQHDIIPIGFTVAIRAHHASNLPVCWLNAGEIVVQGPLNRAQYWFCSITWFERGLPIFRDWPAQFPNHTLPPPRPFQPGARNEITQWWASCQNWVNNMAQNDPVVAASRRSAAQRRAVLNAIGGTP